LFVSYSPYFSIEVTTITFKNKLHLLLIAKYCEKEKVQKSKTQLNKTLILLAYSAGRDHQNKNKSDGGAKRQKKDTKERWGGKAFRWKAVIGADSRHPVT